MVAVVAGSTGLVGSALIQKLLAEESIQQVVSVSRKSLKLPNKKLQEVLVSDFSGLSTVQEKLRGDLYFCCLGTTIKSAGSRDNFRKIDFDAIVEFGKIAKHHHAKSFALVSSMGADKNSTFFYNQVKGETEEALRSLGLTSLTIFRPGLLIGNRKEFRLAEFIFVKTLRPISKLLPSSTQKGIATHSEVLAEAMLRKSLSAQPGVNIVKANEI